MTIAEHPLPFQQAPHYSIKHMDPCIFRVHSPVAKLRNEQDPQNTLDKCLTVILAVHLLSADI